MSVVAVPRGFTTRFAPAPTGHLHLGHLVNAVWVWGLARAFDGRVILRLEDHDRGRCRPEYEQGILEDLEWLGLQPSDASLRFRQSDNQARYAERLAELEARGLAYACRCSRADIERANAASGFAQQERSTPDGVEPRYPGSCRGAQVDSASTTARRIVMDGEEPIAFDDLRHGEQRQSPTQQCGDLLARDRNGNYTYQFCVSVDDFDQGVGLVIRGDDLLESTGRQIRLHGLLGNAHPPRFLHHPLVRHPDGSKLSKSAGDTGIRELRAAGATAAELLGRAARLGGLPHDGSPIAADRLQTLFT